MRGDRRTVNRRTGGSVVAVLVLVGLVAVAPAFACGGNRGTITAAPARADAGTLVDVTGSVFQGGAAALPVKLRWGGPNGQLLAEVMPAEDGTFTRSVTVPAGAQTGWHQISATQKQMNSDEYFTANFAIDVVGAPAPAATQPSEPAPSPSPTQASQPAPVNASPSATPTPQAAPSAQAPAVTQPATARRPAAASAAPAPAPVVPAPVPPAPVETAPVAATPVAPAPAPVVESVPAPVAEPVPALAQRDPAAMGGPRTVTIDSGAPLWMVVPLVGVGLLLFAASCAAVASDVRQRRVKAEIGA